MQPPTDSTSETKPARVVRVTMLTEKGRALWVPVREGTDIYDKYRMPQLLLRSVKRGRSSHTYLVNLGDVAKSLHTRPECACTPPLSSPPNAHL